MKKKEHRAMARILVRLAIKEPGKNWINERFHEPWTAIRQQLQDARDEKERKLYGDATVNSRLASEEEFAVPKFMPPQVGWTLPTAWADAIPTEGYLVLTYTSDPKNNVTPNWPVREDLLDDVLLGKRVHVNVLNPIRDRAAVDLQKAGRGFLSRVNAKRDGERQRAQLAKAIAAKTTGEGNDMIENLKALHEAGVINAEDFERKKTKILAGIAEAEHNASHAALLEAKAKKHGLSAADVKELAEQEMMQARLVSDVNATFM